MDVSSLKKLALEGDSEAQCNLADLYCDHTNAEFYDVTESMHWYGKAAEQGHTRAQWLLGAGYMQGLGVEKDLAKAEHWLIKSAQSGDPEAQYALSGLYMMKSDFVKAEYWLEMAINQGLNVREAKIILESIKLMLNSNI